MQSLTFVDAGRFEWRDRPAPRLHGDAEALVRPVAASICDIDRPLIQGTSPWTGPFAFGHEAVAEVLDAGDDVAGCRPGDLVALTWHINCGRCDRCLSGRTAYCRSVPSGAMYGLPVGGDWGGLFDDVVRVPFADAMLTRVPDGISPIDAVSAGDNLSLGHEIMSGHIASGVRRILVLGSAAVGINQVAFAIALGAPDVVYVDDDAQHRQLARELGATAVAGPPDRDLGTFDLVVDASFDADWLRRSMHLTEPGATVECLGGYFADEPLPLFTMYVRAVNLRLSRANNGPHVAPTLRILQHGHLRPSRWSQPVRWEDAAEAVTAPALKPVAVRDRITPTHGHHVDDLHAGARFGADAPRSAGT
jgi:threonine dehydrogenase-like Zn-dependent dehydrogenase